MSHVENTDWQDGFDGRIVGRFHFDSFGEGPKGFRLLAVRGTGEEVFLGLFATFADARQAMDRGENFPRRLWEDFAYFQIDRWVGPLGNGAWTPCRTNLRPRRRRSACRRTRGQPPHS